MPAIDLEQLWRNRNMSGPTVMRAAQKENAMLKAELEQVREVAGQIADQKASEVMEAFSATLKKIESRLASLEKTKAESKKQAKKEE